MPIFQGVLHPTLEFFAENIEEMALKTYDSVGILLFIRIIEYYKDSQREPKVLDT